MPHRYFTTEISDGTATLRGADAHHLARVMRAKLGDTVILCDGNAVEYTATITGFGDECVEFRVEPGDPSAAAPGVAGALLALHRAGLVDGSAVQQQLFGQSGLTGVGMADDRKRPAALDFFTICHKLVFLLYG